MYSNEAQKSDPRIGGFSEIVGILYIGNNQYDKYFHILIYARLTKVKS